MRVRRKVIYSIRWFTFCERCGSVIIRVESGTSPQEIRRSITKFQVDKAVCWKCGLESIDNAEE